MLCCNLFFSAPAKSYFFYASFLVVFPSRSIPLCIISYWAAIDEAILSLASNPRPVGSKKLTDRGGYRIRSGNY